MSAASTVEKYDRIEPLLYPTTFQSLMKLATDSNANFVPPKFFKSFVFVITYVFYVQNCDNVIVASVEATICKT